VAENKLLKYQIKNINTLSVEPTTKSTYLFIYPPIINTLVNIYKSPYCIMEKNVKIL
jgi:hypothetical protein